VVARLVREFPSLAIDVVVDPRLHGGNLKVSNLINMMARARHDVLAIADSDTWVRPDYLAAVTAPLRDPGVGLVNCLYHDVPTAWIWSRLGAMYINEWYMPSIVLAQLFGYGGYVSGQTLCVRRATLEAVGGLQAVADHLADDHQLGVLVRGRGLRIACSRYLVSALHHEPDFAALARHELRWLGTIRVLQPHSFSFLWLTFSLPLTLLGLALATADPAVLGAAWVPLWIAVGARLAVHWAYRLAGERRLFADLWLVVARDFLIAWGWCRCFFSRRISWRGAEFDVDADGILRRLS